MTQTIKKRCKCCGSPITVRLADHKRGWGNFCDKSCKARHQERRTGQNAAYHSRQKAREFNEAMDAVEWGWDGHKAAGP